MKGLEPWEAELGSARVLFGPGALDRLGEAAAALGAERVLLVTDPGVVGAGHAGRAVSALEGRSLSVSVFDEVEENPTTAHVERAAHFASARSIDCIVGLGGGSAMDCARGVNFLLTNGGRMEDYRGFGRASRPMLASIGVPTTAGTGSEAQSYALITDERSGAKMACGDTKARFRTVVLDPALQASAPRGVAAAAGIDALSHAVESYVTTRANPLSRMLSREAWRLIESTLSVVLESPDRVDAWGRMLWGAHLAGAAIEQSMLGAAHACANPLTARFGVVHGAAVGLMLPHVVRFNAGDAVARYDGLHAASASGDVIEARILELRQVAGLPTRLRDCSIPRGRLGELAAEARGQWTAAFNPRAVSELDLLGLYEAAY